jgi:para-nitrobenzyl esterase
MDNQRPATVATKSGKIEGMFQGGIYVFKGIAYAASPVGALRWLPPQPLEPWEGVKPAREYGLIAPQLALPTSIIIHTDQPQGENCLYLNVTTPGLDNARRPVMVWVHGGAFTTGSGSDTMYDAARLSHKGEVVVVTINYRLGVLGFLRLKEVTGGRIPSTGNEGLMDQIAALKWVRDNIAAFGGDPDNVTVFGESAGGMSIGCLMAMPAAKGLFHKAILESGVGNIAVSLQKSQQVTEQFLKTVNIKGNDIDRLKALTVERLLKADIEMRIAASGNRAAPGLTAVAPTVDGETIPGLPHEVVRQGSAKNIPVIIGTNLEEFRLFDAMSPQPDKIDEATLYNRLTTSLPDRDARNVTECYTRARKKRGEAAAPADILMAIQTDLMFRLPGIRLIEAQQANGQQAFNYLFTWKSRVTGLGACHALEIGFVFGTHDDTFCGSGPEADRLSESIQDAWTSFARTGDPSCKSLGKWPVYDKDRIVMILGRNSYMETAPYEEERFVWEDIRSRSLMPER